MEFPQLNKQLSDESLMALSSGHSSPFTSLFQQLQVEISSKDQLLQEYESQIGQFEQSLAESKKRCTIVELERDKNNEIVYNQILSIEKLDYL